MLIPRYKEWLCILINDTLIVHSTSPLGFIS
jgi:hypothetical protein